MTGLHKYLQRAVRNKVDFTADVSLLDSKVAGGEERHFELHHLVQSSVQRQGEHKGASREAKEGNVLRWVTRFTSILIKFGSTCLL